MRINIVGVIIFSQYKRFSIGCSPIPKFLFCFVKSFLLFDQKRKASRLMPIHSVHSFACRWPSQIDEFDIFNFKTSESYWRVNADQRNHIRTYLSLVILPLQINLCVRSFYFFHSFHWRKRRGGRKSGPAEEENAIYLTVCFLATDTLALLAKLCSLCSPCCTLCNNFVLDVNALELRFLLTIGCNGTK